MDFHSVMETFAEAWVAANTHTPLMEAAEQGLINGTPNGQPNGQPNNQPNGQPNGQSNMGQGTFGSSVLQESSNERHDAETSSDNGYQGMTRVKCIPIHCIVEQIPGPQACGQYVELDSYAIIPGDTLFNELVRAALVKLGYSDKQILGAKGSIQIKNWKPLSFDQITENPQALLIDILGDLTTVATLHIRLYSVPDSLQDWTDTTVRNAVLELLREMSQSKLAKLCPLSQPMLSNIINNKYMGKIGKEKCQEFGKWYLDYRKQHPGNTPQIVPCNKPLDGRLTFHPTKELPVMRDWFQSCRNPSRKTLQMYVDILNQGPVRQQERPKVSFVTLKNWWKNEKQRERKHKAEGHENKKRRVRKLGPKQHGQQKDDECDGSLQVIEVSQLSEPRNLTVSDKSSSTTPLAFVSDQTNVSQELQQQQHAHNKTDYVVLQVPEQNKTNTILNTVPNSFHNSIHHPGIFQKFPTHFDHGAQKIFPGISERFFLQTGNQRFYCPKITNKDYGKHGGQMCADHIVVDV